MGRWERRWAKPESLKRKTGAECRKIKFDSQMPELDLRQRQWLEPAGTVQGKSKTHSSQEVQGRCSAPVSSSQHSQGFLGDPGCLQVRCGDKCQHHCMASAAEDLRWVPPGLELQCVYSNVVFGHQHLCPSHPPES